MNVLAIGAHPDDIELGCGATLATHRMRGDAIWLLVMTTGERGPPRLPVEWATSRACHALRTGARGRMKMTAATASRTNRLARSERGLRPERSAK